MTRAPGDTPYPEAAEFTAHVASLYGLTRVLDVGMSWTPEVAAAFPSVRARGVALPGPADGARPPYPFGGAVALPDGTADIRRVLPDPGRSALLVAGASGLLCGAGGALEKLAGALAAVPLLVVATDDAEPVLGQLAAAGLRPEFVGRTRATKADQDRSAHLLVFDSRLAQIGLESGRAPEGFRVVAIMTVYNEEDVVGPAIEKLLGDGVGVYVVDNWSTDRSIEIVRGFEGRGLVGLERFPDAPNDRFVLRAILRRVAAVAAGLDADWCIHHDADERRCGPWADLGLRDSLWRVDRAGFSAVNHTVLNYRPIDNGHQPGDDFERRMRHFELGRSGDLMLQIKAWKNVGAVGLASSGGHEAVFAGRRVFPYKFLLKHYPIRSQTHGEQKVTRDRVARWDPGERAMGWHFQYDDIAASHSFLRHPGELIEDRGASTRMLYLPEMMTGAGLISRTVPAWANHGGLGWAIYLRSRPISKTRTYQRFRRRILEPLRRAGRTLTGR